MQPFFLFAYVRVFPFSSLFVRLKQWRIHLFKLLGGEKKKNSCKDQGINACAEQSIQRIRGLSLVISRGERQGDIMSRKVVNKQLDKEID